MNLITFALRLPFWVFLLAAVAVVVLGQEAQKGAVRFEAQKALALENGPPPVVDAAQFQRKADIGPAREVRLEGWIEYNYNYHLTLQKRGADTERYAMMIFGSSDPAGHKVVRAAMMLTKAERDRIFEDLDTWLTGRGGAYGELFTINGAARRTATLDDMFDDALRDEGLTRGPNFVFIEPYFEGRAAALAPAPELAGQMATTSYGIAVMLALFGVGKFMARRMARKAVVGDAPSAIEVPYPVARPVTSGPITAPKNSQLAELYEKYNTAAPTQDAAPAPAKPQQTPEPARPQIMPTRSARNWKPFLLGLVVLLVAPHMLKLAGFDPSLAVGSLMGAQNTAPVVLPVEARQAILPAQPDAAPALASTSLPPVAAPSGSFLETVDPVILGFAALGLLVLIGFAYAIPKAFADRAPASAGPATENGTGAFEKREVKVKLASDPFARLQTEPR